MNTGLRFLMAVGTGAVALLSLSYCGNRSEQSASVAPWVGADSDAGWVVVEGVEFPAGMETADPEIVEAYVFAAKHPEVLRYMPCYCGCEHPRTAHESNYDCFVDIIDRSGALPRVTPDPMGFS